jgi:hypothetical protein
MGCVGWANSLQGVEAHPNTQHLNQARSYKMIEMVENEMKRQYLDQAKHEA